MELADFEYAERMGQENKIDRKSSHHWSQELQVYVLPLMIKKDDILAKIIRLNKCGDAFTGKYTEDITLIGKGAGSLPTASAIVSDLNKVQSHT